ncbi:MAG: hypothetical protein ACP5XB_27760 [Isosphaeraceae bacterium]
MLSILMLAWLAVPAAGEAPPRSAAQSLIDVIESLQQPIEDFHCEYEGTIRFKGKSAEKQELGEGGLADSFSATFDWRRGGDTRSDGLHRRGRNGTITRETLVVRVREGRAEQYHRLNDAPLGYAVVQSPNDVNSWQEGCFGQIFLLDKIKRDLAKADLLASVHDDQLDGRPMKVLDFVLKGRPTWLIFRYWIDLGRSGHVVRQETYDPSHVMDSRWDIKLAPFDVGGSEVWMPVSGEMVSYAAVEDHKPVTSKEPTVTETVYVVDGTMQFNMHPGREIFTMKYKPGTPVSDNLRKLQYEFGQQKMSPKPTKAEAETMLKDQLAQAEKQKSTLVMAQTSEGIDWYAWLAWGFAALVVISLAALWIQRRAR